MQSKWYVVRNRPMHAFIGDPSAAVSAPGWQLPVVLVHGMGVAGESLCKLGDELRAHGYRVFIPDLPGFGRSHKHKPPQALDISGLTDALDAWMETAGLPRAAVLGNSLGAQIAADLAARHPERVAAVVLEGPTTDPEARSVMGQIWRWALNKRHDKAATGGMVRAYLQAGLGRVAQTHRYAIDDPIEEKLPRIEGPALVIAGSRDPITPLRWARRVCQLLPNGRLAVIEGAAHSMHGNQPAEVAAHVRDFLDSVAATRPM